MTIKKIISGLFGTALLVSSQVSMAEGFLYSGPDVLTANRPGAVTLSFLGGYYWFAQKRNMNNTFVPSVDLAYNFDNCWAAEFSWTSINTSQSITDGQGVLGNLFTLDGIYRFPQQGRFQPYLLAGVGNIGLRTAGNNSTQQGVFNAGIGGQLFAENFVAFRGEIRDVYATTQGVNDVMASLGLSFLMG